MRLFAMGDNVTPTAAPETLRKMYASIDLPSGSKLLTYKRKSIINPHDDRTKEILEDWFDEHKDDPYVSPEGAKELARRANISVSQVRKWLCNRRSKIGNARSRGPKREKQMMKAKVLFNNP
jgi:hypothetical protein